VFNQQRGKEELHENETFSFHKLFCRSDLDCVAYIQRSAPEIDGYNEVGATTGGTANLSGDTSVSL